MSKRKLLLADDSVTIQKVVNLTFADEGIEVISVGDGDSAMDKVAEITPDLIMADVHMPGLTGYEICEKIRQDEKLRRTPVILLVGSFEPFDEDEARRVGADDYLTKPFQSIRQLVNKVTVLLDSQNSEEEQIPNVSSLEDTLEMDAEELSADSEASNIDEKGFDDEMIQTNHPTNFAFDETQKFEYRETDFNSESNQLADYEDFDEQKVSEPIAQESIVEPSAEPSYYEESFENESVSTSSFDTDKVENKAEETNPETDSINETEYSNYSDEAISHEEGAEEASEKSEDSDVNSDAQLVETENKIQIDEKEERVEEIPDSTLTEIDSEETEPNEIIGAVSQDKDLAETTESDTENQIKTSEEDIPFPETASVLEFDDDDILQLPPLELDFEDEEEAIEPPKTVNVESSTQTVGFVAVPEDNSVSAPSNISPELIDEIVSKVLERLSDKAIKEVAWEVVPPMTELIVKKMAEEKLKD